MKILYFDCFSGISGDMTLGALLDAGWDIEVLRRELAKLKLKGYTIRKRRVRRGEIMGTKFEVIQDARSRNQNREGRSLNEITGLITESKLEDRVKSLSIEMFRRLAEAEGRVHGRRPKNVHFHEIGDIDSIVDIVSVSIAINKLGIAECYSSQLPFSRGLIRPEKGRLLKENTKKRNESFRKDAKPLTNLLTEFTSQEGLSLPVPAPATLELLKGKVVSFSDISHELVTPTGACIILTLCKESQRMPPFRISKIGYGAGERRFKEIPNLLRVIIGETTTQYETDTVTVLETNIDDMSPLNYDYIFERLFKAGALDVSLTAIHMKKSRPGIQLTVIAPPNLLDRLTAIIFDETPTFGVRYYSVSRRKLEREIVKLKTKYGQIRIKIGKIGGKLKTISPEYEDCKQIALDKGISFRKVYDEIKRITFSSISS